MTNKKLLEVLETISLKRPRLWFKIQNANRGIYNNLCRSCQIKLVTIAKTKPNTGIDPAQLCDKCQKPTEERLKHINNLIAEGQK